MLFLALQVMQEQGFLGVELQPLARSILAAFTALAIMLLATPAFIRWVVKKQFGQVVRDNGPESHLEKAGVPTLGGLLIFAAVDSAILLWADLSNRYVWILLLGTLAYGTIGLCDDYKKISHRTSKGLTAACKYFWQSIVAIGIAVVLFAMANTPAETGLFVPFFKEVIALGPVYVLLCYLVLVGSGNAVNLTDGLDGLAVLPVALIALVLAGLAFIANNSGLAEAVNVPHVEGVQEVGVFCGALVGASLGFLWFNAHPAVLFMGDVGSLALGAGLGIVAVIIRQELLLFIMAGVFVAETISVIIQVGGYKMTGRRIFRMAPLHHHFELAGWPESRVVVRFWIASLLFILLALAGLL